MAVDTTEMQTIVERAGAQLGTLAAKEQELTTQLQETEKTLAAFLDAKEQATQRLETKQKTLAILKREQAQAIQLAKLAQGTIKEPATVQLAARLKKQVDTFGKEVAALEKHLADEKEAQREQAIRAQIGTLQRDLEAVRVEIEQTSGARTQAHNELGSLELTAVLEQVATSATNIDALREQLLTAQVVQHELLTQGINALREHPEHLAQLREALPVPEDAIYRVIAAARLYLEVLADVLVALPGNPNSQLPALPDDPAWANKAHAMLQQLPDVQRLKIRRGGSWSAEFGESLAATQSKDLATFLQGYGQYLKEQQTGA
jgi:chromosome segregation ATPase